MTQARLQDIEALAGAYLEGRVPAAEAAATLPEALAALREDQEAKATGVKVAVRFVYAQALSIEVAAPFLGELGEALGDTT